VKVNGVAVTSAQASTSIPLTVGASNIITVIVTAENETPKTYTITVTRAANANANLSGLTVSSGALNEAFGAGVTSYTQSVANSVTSLSVTPTVAETTASVKVNGVVVTSTQASTSIPLTVGASNIVTVIVTAENGTPKTYTITVTRAANANANLNGLTVSSGALNETFGAGVTSYTQSVANNITSLTVIPIVAETTASVKVNGVVVTSAQASTGILLAVGANTITVVVTAENGTPKPYTIIVTRAANSNANLSGLSISSGAFNEAFGAGVISYTQSVANNITSLTVTPTVAETTASVKVNGVLVTSAQASTSIPLAVGENTITVLVTAENGTPKPYTITVTRAIGSSNADLGSLQILINNQPIALTESFIKGKLNYTAFVVSSTTEVTVAATPEQIDYSGVTVNGVTYQPAFISANVALGTSGSTLVTIKVTAQDNTSTKVYSINIVKTSELVLTSASTKLDGSQINLEFIDELSQTELSSNLFVVRINEDIKTVTEATYSSSNGKIVNLKLGAIIIHVGDRVTVDVLQGAVSKLDGTRNNSITGFVVQNTAAVTLEQELRQFGQPGEGIHINQIIQWINSPSKRDLNGDGEFNQNDWKLLLERIESIS